MQDVCVICGEPRSPKRRKLCSSDECKRELAKRTSAEWRRKTKENNPDKYYEFLADNARRTNQNYHFIKENFPEQYQKLKETNNVSKRKRQAKLTAEQRKANSEKAKAWYYANRERVLERMRNK